MRDRLVGLSLALLAAASAACERSPAAPTPSWHAGPPLGADQTLATDATVRLLPFEVGCWTLDTPGGSYGTLGLPQAYRRDGLPVYAVIRGDTGIVSFCNGPFVSVVSIRVR